MFLIIFVAVIGVTHATPPTAITDETNDGLSSAAVAGIVAGLVGGVLLFVIIVAVVFATKR